MTTMMMHPDLATAMVEARRRELVADAEQSRLRAAARRFRRAAAARANAPAPTPAAIPASAVTPVAVPVAGRVAVPVAVPVQAGARFADGRGPADIDREMSDRDGTLAACGPRAEAPAR